MKKILLLLIPAFILLSCNNEATETETVTTTDTTISNETLNLPYTVERTPDWERGDNAHVSVAMNTLRAFELNDMNSLQQYLADSVEFYYDNLSFKGSKDSLVSLFTRLRNGLDTMYVRMQDYESVKSKNRGEEWVGLWYIEAVKPKGGKLDSTMVMDDIKIVNGKVAIIDSKMRRIKN
ncbi:MAG: hypothetical protein ACR2KB_10570 [Chitinophagaceae bacterium]